MRLQNIIGISGRNLAVISLLYFAEGVPFGLINNALLVYFRSNRMSLENIGLLSLIGLAWSLKLLWAPLVDRFGKRHYWMVSAQMTIGLAILALRQINPAQPGIFLWAVMGVMALAAATQDIAIDAYTIDILEEGELGVANGIRSGAFGLISGTLAPMASIGGSIMGGWLTTLWGIGRAIWVLGALQAVSNLGYTYAALVTGGKFTVYGASLVESFTGGPGTAAFLAFLMRLCDKRFSTCTRLPTRA